VSDAGLFLVGSIALYSTGHWIGGSVLLVFVVIETIF
jgi:hypothetical protein